MHFPSLQRDDSKTLEFDLLEKRRIKNNTNDKSRAVKASLELPKTQRSESDHDINKIPKSLRASYSNIELTKHHDKDMSHAQMTSMGSKSYFKMFGEHKNELKSRFDTLSVRSLKQPPKKQTKKRKKNDFVNRLTNISSDEATTIPSLSQKKQYKEVEKEPFSRFKDSFKRNQYIFYKFKVRTNSRKFHK